MSYHSFQAPNPEHLSGLLPQFDIEFFIAQGGMGAVYKGRQLSLDRDVAIKVLPKELGADDEFRESFNTEAKAMAKLNHPNLLGVFDFGNVDGMPYIVMEYVEGGSLYEACFEQAVDPPQAVAIVKGICDGLAHAHEHDIVHRDIKPANILLTIKAEPKVADFGLAHAIDSDQPGLVMGTPGYTAPEVFQDPSQAGKLADIYSVGVIFHQLLTGIDPTGRMEPPSKATGSIRLDAIWRKATHSVPTQRYATVDAMAQDLAKWGSAVRPQAAASGPAPYRPPSRRPARSTAASSSGGGGMGMKIFLIALLVGAVLVTYQVLQKRKDEIDRTNAENAAKPKVEVVEIVENPDDAPEGTPISDMADNSDGFSLPDSDSIQTAIPDRTPPEIVDNNGSEEEQPGEEGAGDLEPGDPELREKAIGLIEGERKKRDAELAENARWFRFQLAARKRDADQDFLRLLEDLEENTTETRIPATTSIESVPSSVADDYQHALDKEEEIDGQYLSGLTRIRDAYVTRLEGAASDAADEKSREQLAAQAARAEDLEQWIALLSPEPEGSRKILVSTGGGGFSGKWQNIHSDNEGKYIAHPDGRLEVVGQTWEVRWEITDVGTLMLHWSGKKPSVYTKDDTTGRWVGKTGFGKESVLVPGDW